MRTELVTGTITYDQALETLSTMFEGSDPDTLEVVLQSNNYSLERAVETLLHMETRNNGGSRAFNPIDFESAE